MSIKGTAIQTAVALIATSTPAMVLAQAPADARPGAPSAELQGLNPPVPEDLELPEQRLIPAERDVAAYNDSDWAAPKTSWGHPRRQQAGVEHAANVETFIRNEWGTRSFGFSSLVVDPPNGRTPPLTEDGRARAAAAAGTGTFGPGPFDTFEDFSLYDRCITRGVSAGMNAVLTMIEIYSAPSEGAEVFDINKGE